MKPNSRLFFFNSFGLIFGSFVRTSPILINNCRKLLTHRSIPTSNKALSLALNSYTCSGIRTTSCANQFEEPEELEIFAIKHVVWLRNWRYNKHTQHTRTHMFIIIQIDSETEAVHDSSAHTHAHRICSTQWVSNENKYIANKNVYIKYLLKRFVPK